MLASFLVLLWMSGLWVTKKNIVSNYVIALQLFNLISQTLCVVEAAAINSGNPNPTQILRFAATDFSSLIGLFIGLTSVQVLQIFSTIDPRFTLKVTSRLRTIFILAYLTQTAIALSYQIIETVTHRAPKWLKLLYYFLTFAWLIVMVIYDNVQMILVSRRVFQWNQNNGQRAVILEHRLCLFFTLLTASFDFLSIAIIIYHSAATDLSHDLSSNKSTIIHMIVLAIIGIHACFVALYLYRLKLLVFAGDADHASQNTVVIVRSSDTLNITPQTSHTETPKGSKEVRGFSDMLSSFFAKD